MHSPALQSFGSIYDTRVAFEKCQVGTFGQAQFTSEHRATSDLVGGAKRQAVPVLSFWSQAEPGRRVRVGGWLSGGLAAGAGAGASGQGDAELAELDQVEGGQVVGAELVAGDGAPVGLRGQRPYTI